ncbi:MAG: hypothetical protein MJB14_19535, partial [Spirochaetes bacterium]|nr:hypothetical protein [Spirochaetota bacterium]
LPDLKDFWVTKKFFLIGHFTLLLLFVILVFFIFVYRDYTSLPLLPYVIFLGAMASIALFSLYLKKWPLLFRLMITLGALIFVLSDLLIGLIGPDNLSSILVYFVNPTYIIAIFLLQYSALFLLQKKS